MGSESFDLSELLQSPEEILRAQQEQMEKAAELERRISEVVGSAATEDERISVKFSETNGVQELTLDPRVMRMPSEELAAEITKLVNAAKTDAQAQVQQAVKDAFGEDGMPNAEELTEQTAQFQMTMDELMRDTMRMDGELSGIMERMRKLTGE